MTPNPGWLPFMKMSFGFLLLVILATIACIIALGKIEEHTSFGLGEVLGGLLTLSGGFVQWAFGEPRTDPKKDEKA